MGSKKRLIASMTVFVLVFVLGVAGFKILGGPEWTVMDAVYMTVITVATITSVITNANGTSRFGFDASPARTPVTS